jgi:hypothetical protein
MPLFTVLVGVLLGAAACGPEEVVPEEWGVVATVEDDHVQLEATIAHFHTDFIHMSIRQKDWDNAYTVDRSPDPNQPERDWSRVHTWFGDMHPDTYLEGRIDDGSARGPNESTTYRFHLPRLADLDRQDFSDENGSDYVYITSVYSYADGHARHPAFGPGEYEIEIYPWYTGNVNDEHPAINDRPQVQYLHHEAPLTSTTFTIE